MRVKRTRELLGEEVAHLSDQEVEQLISEYGVLVDILVESILKTVSKSDNNKLKV